MGTHSRILAGSIPGTEESGRPQSFTVLVVAKSRTQLIK